MCDGCEVNQKYYKCVVGDPAKERHILNSLCIPTQTEIRNQLGPKLADVFFENLSSEGRIFLGLQPPLTGPNDVWINPSSRLRNKVRCEPIPEPQVLYKKALTHHAILEIGREHIDKLKSQLKQEVEETAIIQAADNEDEFEKRLAIAEDQAKQEADEQCKQVVRTLMEHFEHCFTDLTETNKLKMRKECQKIVLEERAELAAHMLMELQREIEKRDLELCSDFHDTLTGELNALERKYIKQIYMERKVAEQVIRGTVEKYEKMLVNLRSEMEMSSTVDLCQAIAEEKAKCEKEIQAEKARLEDDINLLIKLIIGLKKKNKILKTMADERSRRIEGYQKKTKKILDEFQKFVNYSLEATPAHAEFLLSMQKMMLKKYREDSLLDPGDYEEYQKCIGGTKIELNKTFTPTEAPKKEQPCCPKPPEPKKKEECDYEEPSKYAFDCNRFKHKLLKKLLSGTSFNEEKEKDVPEGEPPVTDSEDAIPSEEPDSELDEYGELLTLAGENQKSHLQPVQTFLRERASSMMKLCKNDPEWVKAILGCQTDGKN